MGWAGGCTRAASTPTPSPDWWTRSRQADQRQMIYRMGAALMSLLGLFVSAYLYLYKIGRIGTLACGSGGCETVQTSQWSRFLGVEVALIGLIGYAVLLVVALVALRPAGGAPLPALLLTALAAGGVLFTSISPPSSSSSSTPSAAGASARRRSS